MLVSTDSSGSRSYPEMNSLICRTVHPTAGNKVAKVMKGRKLPSRPFVTKNRFASSYISFRIIGVIRNTNLLYGTTDLLRDVAVQSGVPRTERTNLVLRTNWMA